MKVYYRVLLSHRSRTGADLASNILNIYLCWSDDSSYSVILFFIFQ